MRGFPPLHVFIFVVVFALLAIPLARLTFARVDEAPVRTARVEKEDPGKVPTFIRIRLAHVPTSLSLKVEGQELLSPEQQKPDNTKISFDTELAIPAEGKLEISAAATWPEGTPSTALTLELEPSDKQNQSQTSWSIGNKLSAAYTFNW